MLVLGVAYKADIDDTRESPALKLIELLRADGREVAYHDPHVPELRGLGLDVGAAGAGDRRAADCVVIVTDALRRSTTPSSSSAAQLVVDLRNATGRSAARTARS